MEVVVRAEADADIGQEYYPTINNRDELLDAWSEPNRFVERFWRSERPIIYSHYENARNINITPKISQCERASTRTTGPQFMEDHSPVPKRASSV
uniref:ACAS_N domain-containing protein n=1 Tax=Ascaris lumbricoides TaxID=6252 RepID=A0A0M3I6V7_ASCLU